MLKNAPSFVLARSTPQRTARVRLGISLAAASLEGFFERPAVCYSRLFLILDIYRVFTGLALFKNLLGMDRR